MCVSAIASLALPVRVVVTGAAGSVGRRVVALLHELRPRSGLDIIAVDTAGMAMLPPEVKARQADLASGDLPSLLEGADAVAHTAGKLSASSADATDAGRELALLERLLASMGEARVPHLVMTSTALVYGAWPNNPVPITEDRPPRPNPEFGWAVQRLRLERTARRWRSHAPQGQARAVCILRQAPVVAHGRPGDLAYALRAARSPVAADGDPPMQFLHIDDLASAVVTVLEARYDGELNVAPDGWIPPDALADLEGPRPRLRVRPQVATGVSALRWQWGLTATPPGLVPYTVHPCVVANDRLRGLGWKPAHTNEEAWVVSHRPGRWESMPARQRQEFLLAAASAAVAGAVGTAAWLVSRMRSRR